MKQEDIRGISKELFGSIRKLEELKAEAIEKLHEVQNRCSHPGYRTIEVWAIWYVCDDCGSQWLPGKKR